MAVKGNTKAAISEDSPPILATDIDAKINLLIDWQQLNPTMQKAIKMMNDEIVNLKGLLDAKHCTHDNCWLHGKNADRKFHNHIKAHFEKEHPDWKVKCTICHKTFEEITNVKKK